MSLDGVDLKIEMCWKMFPKNHAMRDDHIVIGKKEKLTCKAKRLAFIHPVTGMFVLVPNKL